MTIQEDKSKRAAFLMQDDLISWQRTYVLYQPTNLTSKFIIILFGIVLSSSLRANDSCQGEYILRSASNDQDCFINFTPLVRCEKFEEFIRSDRQLNNSYKSVLNALSKSDANTLRKVQREWIHWRDATCDDIEEEAKCTNGICLGVAHDSCMVLLTERRHKELTNFKVDINRAKASQFKFSNHTP